MEDETFYLLMGALIVIGIIAFVGTAGYISYEHREAKYENFQVTINDLSDEQKCMHICGFQYPGSTLFDQYKFCLEKCDRISEREHNCD